MAPRGRSNKWTVNERTGREEAGQMGAQRSCNALQWTNLNTEEACKGQKVCDHSNTAAISPHAHREPISLSIHPRRDITLNCFNTVPLHPPYYEVLINWAGVKRNGLTSWLIALALSSLLRIKAAGHTHLAHSQTPRSLVYTSLGRSLLSIS